MRLLAALQLFFPWDKIAAIHEKLSTDPDEQSEQDDKVEHRATAEGASFSAKVAHVAPTVKDVFMNQNAQGDLISKLRIALRSPECDEENLDKIFGTHAAKITYNEDGFIKEKGTHGRTLAHTVCMRSERECRQSEQAKYCKWLIDHKFNMFVVDDYKRIPAFYAAYQNKGEVLKVLTSGNDGEKKLNDFIQEYSIGSTLNKNERHLRTFIFVLIAAFFIGVLSANEVNLSCNTFFGGIVLTPYIVIIANVFFFKIAQWFFDTRIVPFFRSVRRIKSVDLVLDPILRALQQFWGKTGPPALFIQRLSAIRLSSFARSSEQGPIVSDGNFDTEAGISKQVSRKSFVNPLHVASPAPPPKIPPPPPKTPPPPPRGSSTSISPKPNDAAQSSPRMAPVIAEMAKSFRLSEEPTSSSEGANTHRPDFATVHANPFLLRPRAVHAEIAKKFLHSASLPQNDDTLQQEQRESTGDKPRLSAAEMAAASELQYREKHERVELARETEARRERGEETDLEDQIPTSAKGDVDFDDCASFCQHLVASSLPKWIVSIRNETEGVSQKYLRSVLKYQSVKNKRKADYEKEEAIFTAPYLFLYLQCIICVISSGIVFSHVDTSTNLAWLKYTNYFGIIVNSGCPTTVFSLFKMTILEHRFATMRKFMRPQLWLLLSVPIMLLLPPFVTHILPAMTLYSWIIVPFMSLAMNCYVALGSRLISDNKTGRMPNLQRYFFDFFVEIFVRFSIVFLLQTMYNYAVINYENMKAGSTESHYLSSYVVDYQLRTQTYCFFDTVERRTDSLLLLFSFI